MIVGVSVFELHLPHARSLKEKRKVVKSMVERIRRRAMVSVAEVDYQDLHQRSKIAIAAVGHREGEVAELLEGLRRIAEDNGEAFVTMWNTRYLEDPG
jgi:uncharacterized protein YlxP (DUF503 family)